MNGNVDMQEYNGTYENGEELELTLSQEAEVVLISTSLGGIKTAFFSSLRAKNLLDCKKYVYFIIDSNRDTSTAKNLKDTELYTQWKNDQLLLVNEGGVVLPQILIDGCPIGTDVDLQNLEDEGLLDYIVARLKCPSCLKDKSNTDVACPNCHLNYACMISDDLLKEKAVIQLLQGEPYESYETQ